MYFPLCARTPSARRRLESSKPQCCVWVAEARLAKHGREQAPDLRAYGTRQERGKPFKQLCLFFQVFFSPIRLAAAVPQPVPALAVQGANFPCTSTRSHLWLQGERSSSRGLGRLRVLSNTVPLAKLPVSVAAALFPRFRLAAGEREVSVDKVADLHRGPGVSRLNSTLTNPLE